MLETDALVIGSGVAGLSAALATADSGIEVVVISCAPELEETNTNWAQGGIIYKADPVEAPGDAQALSDDILKAGCEINYTPAVRQLVEMGPRLVDEVLLKKAQVVFDRDGDKWNLTREGGHASSRILHWGDQSGKPIEQGLLNACKDHPRIQLITKHTAVNLLMTSYHPKDESRLHEKARCFGAFVFDQTTKEVYPIFASHTVLATGGLGQLYLHNTNSKFARGDGIALAHRAGCRLENLEYIQFHPTTFFHPASRRFLISEALRGEGAVIVNQAGERFLSRYLPEYPVPELAPRDRVAKGIHQEMLSTGAPCVYLDISHRDPDWIRERFPFVYKSCLQYGIDVTKTPIPVVPGAHYSCGGVWTDLEGRTSIPRLWAAGETACTGLHGANRLASTSLLEGLVWGHRAGNAIAETLAEQSKFSAPEIESWKSETATVDASFLSQDWLTLKHTMWNYVGLIKTDARLKRAEGILTELDRGIDVFYRKAALSDALIGLRHASLVALLILDACKKNTKSLGCYQREEWEI